MRYSLLLIILVFLSSCEKTNEDPSNSFDRGPMLDNMGSLVIIPSCEVAKDAADDLRNAAEDFGSQTDMANLEALQQAFKNAYIAFQKVSAYDFGPSKNVALRGSLNTFPADVAKIDNAIMSGSWNLDQLQFADAKGYPALDLLLFGADNATVLDAFINQPNAASRLAFLDDICAEIYAKTEAVYNGWIPTGGNYLNQFTNAKGTDVGSGTGLMVNALNQHFERNLRDGKIGIPAGIRSLGIAIPEKCEAYYGGFSLQLAIENMRAIERMYNGNSLENTVGIGLDNHLVGINAVDLDNRIKAQIEAVIQALQGLSDPLSENITNNQGQVEAAYAELQKLVVLFKVDMPSRLGILITYQDSDGD